jgi:ATP-dependent helicase HrpA
VTDQNSPNPKRRRGKNLGRTTVKPPIDLSECYGPDRGKIRGFLKRNQNADASQLISQSKLRVKDRQKSIPVISYPVELPFAACVTDIKQAIEQSQVVVVCGETGSGKSTQLPKLLLDMGRGTHGMIGHTQPRRLAARAVADRVSEELGCALGELVGYKIRFGDHTGADTLVKLMTDGILLAETRSDRLLEQYDTIIIDEAHERSLNIDFLLGYLHQTLPRRPELKIIITSATIDAEGFAEHFESVTKARVPILEISGRTFPVDILYRPVEDSDDSSNASLPRSIVHSIEELAAKDRRGDPGDVLVFLPGEREIREVAHELRHESQSNPLFHGTDILPLYARLSPSDQQRIFKRSSRRKVVLSTNVAETSLTVPGIRYVIDPGVARMNRYSSRRKIQSLQIETISRASARQRAGRCGRTEPGTCIRLYSETDHDSRDEFTSPEIMRTNLAGVILQMHSLRLGLPQDFPFVEAPDSRRIKDAYDTLLELNAIDSNRNLTHIGKTLARLPVDPRIGRILVESAEEGVLHDALVVASFLEVRDPRDRPFEKRDAADNFHARFRDKTSDFLTVLKLWDHYHDLKDSHSRSQLRKQCTKEYLSYQRMREWTDTHRQLRDISKDSGLKHSKRMNDPEALHRSILAGCLTSIGKRHHEGGFTGSRGGRFAIHPASAVADKGTKWLVAAELVRTTKLFARSVARIDPSWVEAVAEHLIVREYSDPEYVIERGRVEAAATVSLWDLAISKDRLVDYGSVDREHARKIFIEQALVAGQLELDLPFLKHNSSLLEQCSHNEAKLRRSGQPDPQKMFRFFDARLPADVLSAKQFDRWRRHAERENSCILFMSASDLGFEAYSKPDPKQYPDSLTLRQGTEVPMEYRHDPGSKDDGIAIRIPVQTAAAFDPDQANWLVPGWLSSRVEAVLRGLPKDIRRQFDVAELHSIVVESMDSRKGGFYQQIASLITDATGVRVSADTCRSVPLRDHLKLLIKVHDGKGKTLWQGRDPLDVIAMARKAAPKHSYRDTHLSDQLTSWPGKEVLLERSQQDGILSYQALFAHATYATLLRCDNLDTARYTHYFGVRRLANIALSQEVRKVVRHSPGIDKCRIGWACIKGSPKIESVLAGMVTEYGSSLAEIVTNTQFDQLILQAKSQLTDRLNDVVLTLANIADQHKTIVLTLDKNRASVSRQLVSDVVFQLGQLVHAGTLSQTPLARLKQYPRYLQAIRIRLDSNRGKGISRDSDHMALIQPHWKRCIERARKLHELGLHDPQLEQYRWLVEEYRVTLYAQKLSSPVKATLLSLDEQWNRTRSI